jgi:hypothetical protein
MYLEESNLAQQYRGLIQGTQHTVGDTEKNLVKTQVTGFRIRSLNVMRVP